MTCEHVDSASFPSHLQLMGGGGKPGEPGKHSTDIPGPPVLEDLGARSTSPEVAPPKTPASAPRTTKSHSNPSASSPCRGPAPTAYWFFVPCNAPPAISTSDTDGIIGRLMDVIGCAADRRTIGTNEARLLPLQHHFLESTQKRERRKQ
jgi:hypothetical protein